MSNFLRLELDSKRFDSMVARTGRSAITAVVITAFVSLLDFTASVTGKKIQTNAEIGSDQVQGKEETF